MVLEQYLGLAHNLAPGNGVSVWSYSRNHKVTYGVPQRSVLRPLLFSFLSTIFLKLHPNYLFISLLMIPTYFLS